MSMLSGALDHLADQPHYVYEAWMGDVALYVGMTCDLGRRLREHSQQQAWWKGSDRFVATVYPSRRAASDAERLRIRDLRPANNKSCNGDYYESSRGQRDYDEARDLSPEDFAALRSALDKLNFRAPAGVPA